MELLMIYLDTFFDTWTNLVLNFASWFLIEGMIVPKLNGIDPGPNPMLAISNDSNRIYKGKLDLKYHKWIVPVAFVFDLK